MWLVEFLPSWLFHLSILAGVIGLVASFVLSFIPRITHYRLAIQAASVLLIVLGTFFTGASYNNDKWNARVVEAEKRALEAEAQSAKENVKIVTKTVEKIKKVQDFQIVVQNDIVRDATVINADCRIPVEFIAIHNKSATAREATK